MKNQSSFFDNDKKVLALLLLPAVLVYIRSLSFGFTTMDEQWMIVKDTAFLGKWESLKDAFIYRSTHNYYRPLFLVSLILDYHLGKLSPGFYHFMNLAWHLVSVILLFKFLTCLAIPKRTAFFLSLFFSVHPLLLHAVAWVPGRNDIMLLTFTLAALIQLKRYSDTSLKKHLFLHALFFACALFTKESAVILPLVFFMFHRVFGRKEQKAPLLMFIAWIILALGWLQLRHSITPGFIGSDNSLATNIKNAALGYLLFIGKTVLPIQQSVLPTVKTSSLLPGTLTLLMLILLCYKPGLKDKRVAFFGLFFFFVLLLIPVWFGAGKPGSEHYEQRVYGPMIGILVFLSQVKFNYSSRPFMCTLGALFVFYIAKTFVRMENYRNELSYLEAGMKERPDYYLFPLQKADMLGAKHDYPAAIAYYDKALSLRPGYAHAVSNRGSAYYSMRMFKEAIRDFSDAIDHSEFNELYYLNRSHAYFHSREPEPAMRDLMVVKRCCQNTIDKDFEKNVLDAWIANLDHLKTQLSHEQNNAALCYRIANLYLDIEMNTEGMQYLELACLLDPQNAEYREQLKKHKDQSS